MAERSTTLTARRCRLDLPFGPVDPADEETHPAGPELLWSESYYLDFAAADGSLGGYVRIGRYPNLGVDLVLGLRGGPGSSAWSR